jgi:23S rRNA (guanosine2251-2'-O)-methyltransferase
VPWQKAVSAVRVIKKLKQEQPNLRIVALENNVKRQIKPLDQYEPKFPLVLLVGEETKGLSKSLLDLADDIIEIPMKGSKESLNVSVALGIAAHHLLI